MLIGIYMCFLKNISPKQEAVNGRYIISLTSRFHCILLRVERGRLSLKCRMKFFPSLKMVAPYSWKHYPKSGLKSSYRASSLVGSSFHTAGK
jgi:hypothetical protein